MRVLKYFNLSGNSNGIHPKELILIMEHADGVTVAKTGNNDVSNKRDTLPSFK